MANHNEIGKLGENLAKEYLQSKGFTILTTNYRFEKAEIDIIAKTSQEIVFVEVKTRTTDKIEFPEHSVTPAKQNHLFRAADAYLYQNKLENIPARFDVLAITLSYPVDNQIIHYKNAFTKIL